MLNRPWVIASWTAVLVLGVTSSLHAAETVPPGPAAAAEPAPTPAPPEPAAAPPKSEPAANKEKIAAPTGAKIISVGQKKKKDMFSFGLHLGQPTGLQAKARLLDLSILGFNTTHSVLGMVGYDFVYGGVTVHLDYRLDLYRLEFLRQDAEIAFWVGLGGRVSMLEPVDRSKRESPVTLGGRVTPGVTLALNPMPLELSVYGTPLSFDVNALTWPRWRPELGLEIRVRFPYAPGWWPG